LALVCIASTSHHHQQQAVSVLQVQQPVIVERERPQVIIEREPERVVHVHKEVVHSHVPERVVHVHREPERIVHVHRPEHQPSGCPNKCPPHRPCPSTHCPDHRPCPITRCPEHRPCPHILTRPPVCVTDPFHLLPARDRCNPVEFCRRPDVPKILRGITDRARQAGGIVWEHHLCCREEATGHRDAVKAALVYCAEHDRVERGRKYCQCMTRRGVSEEHWLVTVEAACH